MDHNLLATLTPRQPYDPQKQLLRWQFLYSVIAMTPRHASEYPWWNQEELEGRFLGHPISLINRSRRLLVR